MTAVRRLRLAHPRLDFWIDVRLREFDGRWLAVADLAGGPEVGLGLDPATAVRNALSPFGPRVAADLTKLAMGYGG